jgi:hypothetical protein
MKIGIGGSVAVALAAMATAAAAADWVNGVVVAQHGDRLIVQRCARSIGMASCERAACAKGADGKPQACSPFVKPEHVIPPGSPATVAAISFRVRPRFVHPISASKNALSAYDVTYDAEAADTRFQAANRLGLLEVTLPGPCREAVKRFHDFLAASADIPPFVVGQFDRSESCREEPFRGFEQWPEEVR